MNPTDTDEQRIANLIEKAEAGDKEAQFQLGLAYEKGDVVELDDKMAALWFKRSAQQDHPEGLQRYADCLAAGYGTTQDAEKAFTHYLKGANLGNLGCMGSLGHKYKMGEGVEQDFLSAKYWFQRGADAGDTHCITSLAYLYKDGDGVDANNQTAYELFKQSAALGDDWAMLELGRMHLLSGEEAFDYDVLEAVYWLKKGAKLDNPYCQHEYGVLLVYSEDLPKNYAEGIKWLRKATVQEHDGACSDLANTLYCNSEPVDEILYWVTRNLLYQQESELSALYMAYCYNRVAEADDSKWCYSMAAFWWDLACRRGLDWGAEEFDKCIAKGGSLEHAAEIIASYNIDKTEVIDGNQVIPLSEGEALISWDNLPVPPAVAQEMAAYFPQANLPPQKTASLEAAVGAQQTPSPSSQPDPRTSAQVKQESSPPEQLLQAIDPTQLPLGSILAEKYQIEKVLGRGGMAIVFKAKHLLMDRSVAIKMMLPEVSRDATTVQRFKREAQNASALKHPNVITIYDFGVAQGAPYMVMDYLQGCSLEDIIERERVLTVERAMPLMMQTCDALAAAHQEGIIHRDIKPSNIMIEKVRNKEHVRLVDFGIAKALGEQDEAKQKLTKTGEVFGSLVYMSPEQCMGRPLDARSDIYSFGCVLFEIFTGETPFIGDTVFETMTKHIYEDPPSFTNLTPQIKQAAAIEKVFLKCVAKEPEKRYQTMEDVKDALAAIR